MGDLGVCTLPRFNGCVLRRVDVVCTGGQIGAPVGNPAPEEVAGEAWERGEEVTREIIRGIHPTMEANEKRKEVIEYVQGLIKSSLGFEVFPYGSVPLKTFLPDGDIDLTVITNPSFEDASVSDVLAVLKGEEQNEGAPFEVKDVYCIDAEVKLIKCIVQSFVIDVSFNQLGGLCTLCFLEQINQHVGKDNLFKRSIILIKTWCYYESRILGAHHGLISTYALETLVLYIFHLFHSSLNGPLAVLYRFLDYFSKFDWEKYCISLNGPVCKSSLPDVIAELPKFGKGELLLSDEFLKECTGVFSVPSRRIELNSRAFPQKHLNIIDPLKENNNLGRSVNRGNFYRIRSAFKHGACKLGQILLLPREKIANELNKFFANTLGRHGSNYSTCMQNYAMDAFSGSSNNSVSLASSSSSSHSDLCFEDNTHTKSAVGYNGDRNVCLSDSKKSDQSPDSSSEGSHGENGKDEKGISFMEMVENFVTRDKMSEPDDVSESSTLIGRGESNCISENSQSLNFLLDLRGDYANHFRSVAYSQYCHLYSLFASSLPSLPVPPQLLNKNLRANVRQSVQWKQNTLSQGVFGVHVYHVNRLAPVSPALNFEENRKRGTGTYIPKMDYYSYRNRKSLGRERSQASRNYSQVQRHAHENGSATTLPELNSPENVHELSEVEYPHLGSGKPTSPGPPTSLSAWGSCKANVFSPPLNGTNTGSQGFRLEEEPVHGNKTLPHMGNSYAQAPPSSPIGMTPQNPDSDLVDEKERDALWSYQLKDEIDFPPLSH